MAMMLQRAALLLATLAIHSANALSPGAEVTVGAVRVQALSDTLIRVECAAANTPPGTEGVVSLQVEVSGCVYNKRKRTAIGVRTGSLPLHTTNAHTLRT